MRISDWSSDVCSSDLVHLRRGAGSCRCLARDRRRQSRWPRPAGPRLLLPHRRQIEGPAHAVRHRSEEHTSELQSLMRISYAVFCLKKKEKTIITKAHLEFRPKISPIKNSTHQD